jgi:hypothetical protein
MMRMFQAAALLGAMASAGTANAACTQASVAGTWTSYEVYAGGGETGSVVTCHLQIDSTGKIEAPSSCKEGSSNLGSATGSVVLTNPGWCAYKVTISQSIRNKDLTLNDATLALGDFMHGAGLHGGTDVIFDMIRVK